MTTITVEDFFNWLKDDAERDLTYTQKAVIHNVVKDYADKYGLEKCNEDKAISEYEDWLDQKFKWAGQGKSDIKNGISTLYYNALRRACEYDKENHSWKSLFKTNRDLVNASDDYILDKTTHISSKGLAEIRLYLQTQKERILGNGC